MPPTVTMVDSHGSAVEVPDDPSSIAAATSQGFAPESAQARAGRVVDTAQAGQVDGVQGTAKAGLSGFLRGGTLGFSDLAGAAMGDQKTLADLDAAHGVASTVGNVIGAVATGKFSPSGLASSAGKSVAKAAGEGIVGGIAGGAVEGAIQGAGQGVSELALSDDPLTLERAVSVLSSNALLGGAVGGAVGGLGRAAEKGLSSVKGAIDEYLATAAARDAVPENLAGLDAEGLRGAKATEVERIKATKTADTETFVDSLKSHREASIGDEAWLATKGAKDGELRELGAQTGKADDRIRNILNNKKAVVESPKPVLSALTQQEQAYQSILDAAPKIRAEAAAAHAGEEIAGSVRLASLDKIPALLERNRALQEQLKGIIAAPASAHLDAIAKAGDVLGNAPAQGMVEKAGRGALFGAAVGAVGSIPVLGQIPGVAHLLGAKLADSIGNKVFGRLGAGASEVAKRTSAAVSKFLDVAPKVGAPIAKAAPVLATKVLASVRYAPPKQDRSEPAAAPGQPKLAESYRARAAEIRSQVAPDPQTGKLAMRPEARAEMAERLKPIAAAAPKIADQIETITARRLEFLASKLPVRPDLPVPPGGKDIWRPSDFDMRTFARYASAVEDPGGVEERLAHGTVTPEDAEAYQTVYPERFAHLQQSIIERLPELRSTLPYKRRLALSIFTGEPVDASMDPRVFQVLQDQFKKDDASGGMQAPAAQPQFGSVKKSQPSPTAAQTRNG